MLAVSLGLYFPIGLLDTVLDMGRKWADFTLPLQFWGNDRPRFAGDIGTAIMITSSRPNVLILLSGSICLLLRLNTALTSKHKIGINTPLVGDFDPIWDFVVNNGSDVSQFVDEYRSTDWLKFDDLHLRLYGNNITSKIGNTTRIEVMSLSLYKSGDVFCARKLEISLLRMDVFNHLLLGFRSSQDVCNPVDPADFIPLPLTIVGCGVISWEESADNLYLMVILDVWAFQLPSETLNVTTTILFGPCGEKISLDLFDRTFFLIFSN